MKVLVFGTGEYYNRFKYLLKWDEIVGFLDNDVSKKGKFFDGIAKIDTPDMVTKYEYDRIYLASVHMKDMFYQLVNMGVPANRIFDIRDAFDFVKEAQLYKCCKELERKIYVFCPLAITGGPEALHQFADSVYRNITKDVFMVYTDQDDDKQKMVEEAYSGYKNGGVVKMDQVTDDEDTIIVIPEVELETVENYKRARVFFWWLSVDNFFHHRHAHMIESVKTMKRVSMHMCQSHYARFFLETCDIPSYKIFDVSDYTSPALINEASKNKKENLVLYNPMKSLFYMHGLIKEFDDSSIQFVPIENLSPKQVCELMKRAKVYIDMGRHPGKDRMPREAAINGCCIITGLRGAAGNNFDVPIPPKYKINQEILDYADVITLIKDCIYNYDKRISDFEEYTNMIKKEREVFDEQIATIFS